MTLPASGRLALSQINTEFGRGRALSAHRAVQSWDDANNTATFASTNLRISHFYGRRAAALTITYSTVNANCGGVIGAGNCFGNAGWAPPSGAWWSWGFGFGAENPYGFDLVGGASISYQAVTVSIVSYSGYTATSGTTSRRYAYNCNCGPFNCYDNCNCNCNCNCGSG